MGAFVLVDSYQISSLFMDHSQMILATRDYYLIHPLNYVQTCFGWRHKIINFNIIQRDIFLNKW